MASSTSRPIRTRFAPSPTGMLHIGGARTALFSYLYARHTGGQFLLRIEDTDKERSTPENCAAILDGLAWLGLNHDDAVVYQSKMADQHVLAAEKLLAEGKAYKCTCTPAQLDAMRAEMQARGEKPKYNNHCRDNAATDSTLPYVIRLKAPLDGTTSWNDAVQGRIDYPNQELDDFVLLRSDGTPTYNLAVVVDDASMGITHVMRGDDHINNTPKQILLYQALGLPVPTFAHMPLIHGDDGKKLSKRYAAVAVTNYRDDGYLPEAVLNYLMQLGWAPSKEVISLADAAKEFDITRLNKGAATFNTSKLDWLNAQYLRTMPVGQLVTALLPFLPESTLSPAARERLELGLPGLAKRAQRLTELAAGARIYLSDDLPAPDEKAAAALHDGGRERLAMLVPALAGVSAWDEATLEALLKDFLAETGCKMPQLGMPLRAALVGTTQAPGLAELLVVFGKDESLRRLRHQAESAAA